MPRPSLTKPAAPPAPAGMPSYPYMPAQAPYDRAVAEGWKREVKRWVDQWGGRNFRIPSFSELKIRNGWPANLFVEKGGTFRFRRVLTGDPSLPNTWKLERVS